MHACSRRQQTMIGLFLAALMAATRFHHFGDALHLPDASWAIFFLAGFYLAPAWLIVFLLQAAAIDYAAIAWLGTSAYCVTPAYAALLPAYAALWLGGRWLARHRRGDAQDLARWLGAGVAAGSLAFLISNASFYWLGERIAGASLADYAGHFLHYYPHFLGTTLLYLGLAAAVHWGVFHLLAGRDAGAGRPRLP